VWPGRPPLPTLGIYSTRKQYILVRRGPLLPKRLIDLDDDLLAAAQRELSTTGVSDTVRVALQQAAAKSARVRQIEWLEQGGLESMAGPDERGEVWR
jgi:Arc/MetJ family transcription regulator